MKRQSFLSICCSDTFMVRSKDRCLEVVDGESCCGISSVDTGLEPEP